MAKYSRHDPRNKKRNNHKNKVKEGRDLRFHKVGNKMRWKDSILEM